MNSSTSSSNEWKVVAVVVAVLLGAELAVRTLGLSVSINAQNIRQFPRVAQELHAEKSPRVMFMGNSLTRLGVNIETFERGFGPASCAKIVADGTNILDWYYIYRQYFDATGLQPDVMIVGFAQNQLSDDRTPEPRHLAEFCTLSDVPELFQNDLTSFADRADFLVAYSSDLYAQQERIKHRILRNFVPHYAECHQQLNKSKREVAKHNATGECKRLTRWLALLTKGNVKGVFVAMPVAGSFELDRAVPGACQEHGAIFIDARKAPGISEEGSFSDGYHLNEQGSQVYSEFLGKTLAEDLQGAATKAQAADDAQSP